ncbi:MAG: hypothetical protein FJ279_19720 [Planctomycetes bacterium]|nr:hypothetical protein [Planctomycetota bacterium]
MADDVAFHDDFRDGLWAKFPGNPVMVRSQEWERDYICEPNILFEDGLFKMWYAGFPAAVDNVHGGTAVGYATSSDGVTWRKHPQNPVLSVPGDSAHRPTVMKHRGTYYLFAVDKHEHGIAAPAIMRRWTSADGLTWRDPRVVMTATQPWENRTLSNMAVVVDEEGVWRMLYTGCDEAIGGYFGYAHSRDGLAWTKHEGNPVIRGLYGGDPFLVKIGDRYYTWHSQSMGGSLRICCRWSADMIDWHPVSNHPQMNYTQPWERGVPAEQGGTTVGYYGHLTDATLCEAQGKVFLIYQGAQTPLGAATFDGTFAQLAERLQRPPLAKWKESPYGMVEGGTLKIADNGSDRAPLVAEAPGVRERYVLESRIQCYAGATHRVSVIMRYADDKAFARFWLHDAEHTYYQECLRGLFSTPINVGANHACDATAHDWTVEVDGDRNRLAIDGRVVGECRTSAALLARLAGSPVHVGFSTLDTYASIQYTRVRSPR